MILEILIFLFSTSICYYLYIYFNLHAYFKRRGVKYLPGVPLFGNIFESTFLKKHVLEELDAVYNAFPDEKYVGFVEMTTPVLLIRDPEVVKRITIKDFDHFTDQCKPVNVNVDPLFGGSLILMKGQRWRDMRNTLSPAFTGSKMKTMMPLILEATKNIIEYLNENQFQDIDVDDLMRRYTSDVIASAGFGLQINSVKDRNNEFFKMGISLFDFTLKQRMILFLDALFPKLIEKLGCHLFSQDVYDFFTNIVASTVEYRKKNNVTRPDMIQLLMDAKKEWTQTDLTGQVFVFFFAGFETTASALVLTIHELALNEDVQEKLHQECKQFKEENELTFDNLAELKYLDCVINETLRKWTPAILLDRKCTKTYELPALREGGKPYMLQPGDIVYNLVNQLQMDPKYYLEPQKYCPERFSEDCIHSNNRPFMPFGSGPRTCIGMRFALMELKVLLYHLILNFKIVKTSKTQDEIRIMPHVINIKAVGGTIVRFEKRQRNYA